MGSYYLQLCSLVCLYSVRNYIVLNFLPQIKTYIGQSITILLSLVISFFLVSKHSANIDLNIQLLSVFVLSTALQIIPIAIILYTFSHCGRICDVLRGAHHAELNYLGVEVRQSPLEHLFQMVVLCLALQSGAYFCIVSLTLEPYQPDLIRSLNAGYIEIILKLCSHSLVKGVGFALPIFAFCVIFEISAALIERIFKSSGIANELIALKMLLVVMLIALALYNGDILNDCGKYLHGILQAV
ncbi:MAG: flagellar biosynthetic protein FliR [Deltaproteobacteria bacterium]|nr:flagellar biosynthetic protein FliR [Deltaproteobacteria bacterium]